MDDFSIIDKSDSKSRSNEIKKSLLMLRTFLFKHSKVVICCDILLIISLVTLVVYSFCAHWILIENIEEECSYQEFVGQTYKVKTSLFIDASNTVWNINGYDFFKGKKVDFIPAVVGENTLIVTNGSISKEYNFTIWGNDIDLLDDDELTIANDYLDYDGDGIPNIKEKELNLSTYLNDTDGDGLYDNVEMIMGLNPLKADSYKKIRTYEVYEDNDKSKNNYLVIKGKGNIANTFLDKVNLNNGFNQDFIVSDVMTLVTSNEEKPQEMSLYFKNDEVAEYSIYEYSNEGNNLNKLETEYKDGYYYAKVTNFNNFYFLGNTNFEPGGQYKNQIVIVLDNSGSMYSAEYVYSGKTIPNDVSAFGKDADFKRLSLMNSLVDNLGVNNYEYSVYSFTDDLCEIVENSKNIEEIKAGINSLKKECQNFNGTNVSGAIRKYAAKFDTTSPGVKYMIVLTDGNDTGIITRPGLNLNFEGNPGLNVKYKLTNNELSKFKKDGIKIITIGLGDAVNSSYLKTIATQTDGKYLYVSDADMLENLVDTIESSINNQHFESIGDKEVTVIDSNFKVNKDGFSFKNFSSVDTASNSYGFVALAKKIYMNDLEKKASNVSGTQIENTTLLAYSLTDKNQQRLVNGKTFSLKLNDDMLSLMYGDYPKDFYVIDDKIPRISSKYRDLVSKLGYEPSIREVTSKKKININGKNGYYSRFEDVGFINAYDSTVADEYTDDYQVLQLINRNFREQKKNLINKVSNKSKLLVDGQIYRYEYDIVELIKGLQLGSPAILSIDNSFGGHSLLVSKIYKTKGMEEYTMMVYDANLPGEEQEVHMLRQTPYYDNAKTSYYRFDYNLNNVKFYDWMYVM